MAAHWEVNLRGDDVICTFSIYNNYYVSENDLI